jgi:hypothetical protein
MMVILSWLLIYIASVQKIVIFQVGCNEELRGVKSCCAVAMCVSDGMSPWFETSYVWNLKICFLYILSFHSMKVVGPFLGTVELL